MIYAILLSVAIHLLLLGWLMFSGDKARAVAYPRIMTVDLVSLPPAALGVPEATPSQPVETQTRPAARLPTPQQETRVTEIQKRKRPTRQTPQPPAAQPQATATTKSPPAGLPQGVRYGSEFGDITLEGGKFETPTYLNILFAKIKGRWDNPFQGSEQISCTIYFTIERSGRVIDATIEKSSGIDAFDQAALRAVLAANPPPLPLEFTGDELGIHLEFQYLP